MRTKSPTSMAIALRQMQIGGAMTIAEAMRTEFRIVSRICRGKDFYEGVRATIVDKDGKPVWSPARVEDDACDGRRLFRRPRRRRTAGRGGRGLINRPDAPDPGAAIRLGEKARDPNETRWGCCSSCSCGRLRDGPCRASVTGTGLLADPVSIVDAATPSAPASSFSSR